jgi:hypothetical protein
MAESRYGKCRTCNALVKLRAKRGRRSLHALNARHPRRRSRLVQRGCRWGRALRARLYFEDHRASVRWRTEQATDPQL